MIKPREILCNLQETMKTGKIQKRAGTIAVVVNSNTACVVSQVGGGEMGKRTKVHKRSVATQRFIKKGGRGNCNTVNPLGENNFERGFERGEALEQCSKQSFSD